MTDKEKDFIDTDGAEAETEEENIIELEDDEGNVEKYLHIGTMEEDEVVEFLLRGEGEDQRLVPLEDETLMDEVFAEFCHQYEEYEDSDDAMRLER